MSKLIDAIKFSLSEHIKNRKKLWTIGLVHAKTQTIRTSLGLSWILIRDIIYFFAFVMFKYLISGSREVDDMHFIIYLMTGIVPWNIMNDVLNSGSLALRRNSGIVKKINFPITILPAIEVNAVFIRRFFTFAFPFVVLGLFGNIMDFSVFLFIYYFIALYVLMFMINNITSAFVAISEDFYQLYLSVIRILFFSLPIIWSFERVEDMYWVKLMLRINPMVYIIDGFRDAYVTGTLPEVSYSIYFWFICVVLYVAGAMIQYKLRRFYSDFI